MAAFTSRGIAPVAPSEAEPTTGDTAGQVPGGAAAAARVGGQGTPVGRRRGQGATVALSVRLARADWERLHQLAVAEGVSLQEIMMRGLSQVFTSKGLPGIGA